MVLYTWNSSDVGKTEYHEWFQKYAASLSAQGISHVLPVYQINIFRSANLHEEEPPLNHRSHDTWIKLKQNFLSQTQKLYKEFDTAIGILQSNFTYLSMARSTIEEALTCPADTPIEEWLPES